MQGGVKLGVKVGAILISGVILVGSITGCSIKRDTIKVALNDNAYNASSLQVLYNEEENALHICEATGISYQEINTYGYRLKPHLKENGQYGYGYIYGPINESKVLYKYTDIESREVVAVDRNMNGYMSSELSSYFSEDYAIDDGIVYYNEALSIVKSQIEQPVKIVSYN